MKIKYLIPCLVVAFTFGTAAAEELVRFQDGRYLKVDSHQVRGAAVRLTFPSGSVIVLPLDRVDTIKSGRAVVYSAGVRSSAPEPAPTTSARTRRATPAARDERG